MGVKRGLLNVDKEHSVQVCVKKRLVKNLKATNMK